ncbi:MAG: hypothetical protein WAL01_01245, partial [Pseudolabrys sp.]
MLIHKGDEKGVWQSTSASPQGRLLLPPPSAPASRQKSWQKFVQNSLNTTSLAEAKKLRALRDLEWDARFDALKDATPAHESARSQPTVNSTDLSEGKLLRLVREYVEHKDKEFRKRFAGDPPQSER